MRLYSRSQLFASAVCGFLISGALFSFIYFSKKGLFSQSVDNNAVSYQQTFAGIPAGSNVPIYDNVEEQNISIYEKYNSGVVNITTEVLALNWFMEPVPKEGASGSGAIIDPKGYILTNTHVVENAYKLQVTLSDGTQYEGKVVGKDVENDLAVIKIEVQNKELTVIPLGTSSNLKVGQKVLAIGNPFGYDRTLTTGIVSGLGRPVITAKNLIIQNMIQTDASINPGNSGGPLLNTRGELIGINTMIYSPSGGSVGIGFAVPVDTAVRVVPDLIKFGEVKRGWIDIVPVQLDNNIIRYAKLSVSRGILVSKVVKGGAADLAGIKGGSSENAVRYGRSIIYFGGDILVELDGQSIAGYSDLFAALEDNKPGDKVSCVVNRGGKELKFTLTLSHRSEQIRFE